MIAHPSVATVKVKAVVMIRGKSAPRGVRGGAVAVVVATTAAAAAARRLESRAEKSGWKSDPGSVVAAGLLVTAAPLIPLRQNEVLGHCLMRKGQWRDQFVVAL
jgi:hypothetical protein